jgi:hypothetical protein
MVLQVMEPPTKEVMEKVRSEFGLNEQRVREAIEHLKHWIQLQPHLPKEIGKFEEDKLNRGHTLLKWTFNGLKTSPFWDITR